MEEFVFSYYVGPRNGTQVVRLTSQVTRASLLLNQAQPLFVKPSETMQEIDNDGLEGKNENPLGLHLEPFKAYEPV